jgi:hypothetical protein
MKGKIDIHEKSINLARRWSVQNENDLMQVSMVLLEGTDVNSTIGKRWDLRSDPNLDLQHVTL